jgi:hypothetical protein
LQQKSVTVLLDWGLIYEWCLPWLVRINLLSDNIFKFLNVVIDVVFFKLEIQTKINFKHHWSLKFDTSAFYDLQKIQKYHPKKWMTKIVSYVSHKCGWVKTNSTFIPESFVCQKIHSINHYSFFTVFQFETPASLPPVYS